MSVLVQVFSRRRRKTFRALMRPAAEKREGTKSREVGHRQRSERYGDFMSASLSMVGVTPARGDVHVGMKGTEESAVGISLACGGASAGGWGNDGRRRVERRQPGSQSACTTSAAGCCAISTEGEPGNAWRLLRPRRRTRKHRSDTFLIDVEGDKRQRLAARVAPLMHETVGLVDQRPRSLCLRLAVDGVRTGP
jgi:hypothetical protein